MNNYFEQVFFRILSNIKELTIDIGTAIRIEQQGIPMDSNSKTVYHYHTEVKDKIEQLSSRAAMLSFKTDQYCLIKVYGIMLLMIDRALRKDNYKSRYIQLKLIYRMMEDLEDSSTFSYWRNYMILGTAVKEVDG
jgi:hypothetical protein